MDNKTPKLGKKGALKEVVNLLTEIRKKPLSKVVHEIIRAENYEANLKNLKKEAYKCLP
ncbi:MAG TPA: hypothetical protein VIG33_02050 [Pseudobdellovibrionaceae bacterium]|jgi:hypothetical protein